MRTRVWVPSNLTRGGGPSAESPWTEQLTGQDVWILWWEELRQPERFAAAAPPFAPRPGGSAAPETALPRKEGPEEQKPEASHHGEVARPPLPPRGCPGARLPSAGSPLQRDSPGPHLGEGCMVSPAIPFTGPGRLQVRPKDQRGCGVPLGPLEPAKGGHSLRTICPLTKWGRGSPGARLALPWASATSPGKGS